MSDRKWIHALRPETPLDDAARVAIRARMEVLCAALPPAIRPPEKDPEPVHQLRVAARRATAALDQFGSMMDKKRRRRLSACVKRVRRAASVARDWDVFAINLREFRDVATPSERSGFDFLIGYALGRRSSAQGQLVDALADRTRQLEHLTESGTASIRAPSSGPSVLQDLARIQLRGLTQDLTESGSGDRTRMDQLHRIRVHGKRLRYALELFGGCCKPEALAVIEASIVEMQGILGRANDSHVALGRLSALRETLEQADPIEWDRVEPAFASLLALHEASMRTERASFELWWAGWCSLDPSGLFETSD